MSNSVSQIYVWQSGKSYYLGQFKGRCQVTNNTGNANLSIFNMQASDSGVYRCSVYNLKDGAASEGEKSVLVSVLGTYFTFSTLVCFCARHLLQ